MYNREMDTAAKMVSYGTTYLLRNGLNSVHMSLTELKDSDLISRSVYMCFKCSGCVFVLLGIFVALLSSLKVSVMGQRSGQFHSLLYP